MKRPTVLDELMPPRPARADSPAARTRRRLLDSANELIRRDGRVPSVSEVAEAAAVSRATAYRYFPTRSRLIAAVVDSSLGPVRSWEPSSDDAQDRVDELLNSTFGRFKEFEIPMRAALQLALEHAALDRAGLLNEEPYRRGYRVRILQTALAPLKPRLPRRTYDRLWRALSLVYGIEPYVVFKDMWGASDADVEDIARWMAGALMREAMRELVPAKEARKAR
ncbi:MAG TPA: TetR/AcrR family transcriptional regulator [Burkholderiaceae bacterium]|nr:TetR/AcrR family transcriptional regulator [Burkholderiaceae bacterium]